MKKRSTLTNAPPQVTPSHRSPPPTGRLKLNVDAAIFANNIGSGIGAIIRDEYGKVAGALSKRLLLLPDGG